MIHIKTNLADFKELKFSVLFDTDEGEENLLGNFNIKLSDLNDQLVNTN